MQLLAILLIAVPFVFGTVRLGTTGEDARYLWTAFASTCGAATLLWGPGLRDPVSGWRTSLAGAAATASAAATAALVGARSAVAVAVVSLGFALCSTLGLTLLARARRQAWQRRESGE